MAILHGPTRYKDVSKATIPGVDAELEPNRLLIELAQGICGSEHLAGLWHKVNPPDGMAVRLTSLCDRITVVRLSTVSESETWRQQWPKWTFAVRQAPELLGGQSVEAQDAISDDGTELTLLLLPGETREAVLQFDVRLDGATYPGRHCFEVVINDITSQDCNASCQLAGLLEIAHPPSKMLGILPSAYRETTVPPDEPDDGLATSFFQRYLRGFDDSQEELSVKLDRICALFGAYSSPSDFLPWLASWLGLVLDENWPEMKRRRLIAEAVELYRWRGTRRGLSRYLEIYADVHPDIDDRPFRGMRLGPETKLGVNTVLGDIPDHTFVITLAVPDPSAINERTVRDIVEAEKPAHAGYSLRIVRRDTSDEERISV